MLHILFVSIFLSMTATAMEPDKNPGQITMPSTARLDEQIERGYIPKFMKQYGGGVQAFEEAFYENGAPDYLYVIAQEFTEEQQLSVNGKRWEVLRNLHEANLLEQMSKKKPTILEIYKISDDKHCLIEEIELPYPFIAPNMFGEKSKPDKIVFKNPNENCPIMLFGVANLPVSVREFHAPSAQLLSIPSKLAALTNLTTINVSRNTIDTLPQEALGKLPKLKLLDVSYNRLEIHPDSLMNIQDLTVNLDGNLCAPHSSDSKDTAVSKNEGESFSVPSSPGSLGTPGSTPYSSESPCFQRLKQISFNSPPNTAKRELFGEGSKKEETLRNALPDLLLGAPTESDILEASAAELSTLDGLEDISIEQLEEFLNTKGIQIPDQPQRFSVVVKDVEDFLKKRDAIKKQDQSNRSSSVQPQIKGLEPDVSGSKNSSFNHAQSHNKGIEFQEGDAPPSVAQNPIPSLPTSNQSWAGWGPLGVATVTGTVFAGVYHYLKALQELNVKVAKTKTKPQPDQDVPAAA